MNRLSRYCSGLIESAWLLAVIVTPLFLNADAARPFVDKIALLRSIALVGLAAWAVKWISDGGLPGMRLPGRDSVKKFLRIPLVLPILGLLSVYLVSSFLSISPLVSFQGSYARFEGVFTLATYMLIFCLMAVHLRRRAQIERMLAVLAAVTFAVDFYAILQHFGLDPVTWSETVSERASSTIGNAIFTAAFLGMASFALLGRAILALQTFRSRAGQIVRVSDLVRALLYGIISILTWVAMWFTLSRGPLLGLFAGLVFFAVLLALYLRMRRVLVAVTTLGTLSVVFLLVLAFSGLHQSVLSGQLGRLFDFQNDTSRIRTMIWDGVSRLVTPHAPLMFPDKREDTWNLARPLVGYGAETLVFTFEGYYNPQMYELEHRALVYDRAHNEFWNTLAFFGLFGLIAEYGLFLSVFYFGLCWLGFIPSPRDRNLYWGLSLVGGVLGALGAALAFGTIYIGLGFPLGLLLGLGWTLIYRVFRPVPQAATHLEAWLALTIISLLSAVFFHYLEILVGISVATSSVVLWGYYALLFVIGWVMPGPGEVTREIQPQVVDDAGQQLAEPPTRGFAWKTEWRQVVVNSACISILMMVIGADFIAVRQAGSNIAATLSNVFSVILQPTAHTSYGILALFVGTLLVCAVLLQLESDSLAGRRVEWRSILFSAGFGLLVSGLFWIARAAWLNHIQQIMQSSDALATSAGYTSLLSGFYAVLLVVGLVWAAGLAQPGLASPDQAPAPRAIAAVTGYVFFPLLALFLSVFFNLLPMQADILFKQVQINTDVRNYAAAMSIYNQMVQIMPSEYNYLLYSGKIYSSGIYATSDPVQKEKLFQTGLSQLQKANEIAPLSIDVTMALAGFYRLAGDFTDDYAQKNMRFSMANLYFITALNVKPERADYWLDWAEFRALVGDLPGAREKVDAALAVAPTDESAYALSGDLYAAQASSLTDASERAITFMKAVQAYQSLADMITKRGGNPASTLVDIAYVYETMQQYTQARETLLRSTELGNGAAQWDVYKRIADLSLKLNDPVLRREYLQKAIEAAPQDEKAALEAELKTLVP